MRGRKLVAVAATVAGVATVLVPATVGAAANNAAAPVKVTVTMSDFKFKLSTTKVPVGKQVAFTVINKGPSPHDFDVKGTKGTPIIASGKRTAQKVTFNKAASLRFVCSVPGHAKLGMVGTLKVS